MLFRDEYLFENMSIRMDKEEDADKSGYLEDPRWLVRKLWICVEGSIGLVLLDAHDLYSTRGKFGGF